MSPDSRDVSLRYVGNSSSHREEIPNRRVWSQVLLPDVGLLNMLQEGFLVVEVTSSSGSGGPHGSNCVVNGELVVHEDGLWLVAPRSPGVYLLEQVAVEGRRFSRKESIEEGEVPAVREEAMDCEELMEECEPKLQYDPKFGQMSPKTTPVRQRHLSEIPNSAFGQMSLSDRCRPILLYNTSYKSSIVTVVLTCSGVFIKISS